MNRGGPHPGGCGRRLLALAALAVLAFPWANAQAGPRGGGFRGPYYRPYYRPYYGYRPYVGVGFGVIVGPAPVYVVPAPTPVYVQPVPTSSQPPATFAAPAPATSSLRVVPTVPPNGDGPTRSGAGSAPDEPPPPLPPPAEPPVPR